MSYTAPPIHLPVNGAISLTSIECIGIDATAMAFGATGSAVWPTANLGIFIPFQVAAPFTVSKIHVWNGTAVSGNIDAGIYDDAGIRLVSMGSTAQTGTSTIQVLDIANTVINGPARLYYAQACDNTTATFTRVAPANAYQVRAAGICKAATVFPLPSTVTFVTATDLYIPVFSILQSDV